MNPIQSNANSPIIDLSYLETLKEKFNPILNINLTRIIPLLTCWICKGIYRNPYTTIDCNHTFCNGCIVNKILSDVNFKNCPISDCNFDLSGKPIESLVKNHNIEAIIDIIFPELREEDRRKEEEIMNKLRMRMEVLPGDMYIDKVNSKFQRIELIEDNKVFQIRKNKIKIRKDENLITIIRVLIKKINKQFCIDVSLNSIQISNSNSEVYYNYEMTVSEIVNKENILPNEKLIIHYKVII